VEGKLRSLELEELKGHMEDLKRMAKARREEDKTWDKPAYIALGLLENALKIEDGIVQRRQVEKILILPSRRMERMEMEDEIDGTMAQTPTVGEGSDK